MNFYEFERKCSDFFEQRKWWSFLRNLRIWEKLPGDETKDKTIWYCLWELNYKTTMFLFYDYDTTDKPFVVYVDWKKDRHDDPFFNQGKFCFVEEFDTLETALECMCKEPVKYIANPELTCSLDYIPFAWEGDDDRPAIGTSMFESYSLLEAIDKLNEYSKQPNDHDKGHIATIVHMPVRINKAVLYEKLLK